VIDASAFNTIMMEFHPGWARYDVLFSDDAVRDAEPLQDDLDIPAPYRDDLARLVRELDLPGRPAEQALAVIENFFAANFSYSLTQTGRYPRGKYLSKFLFETRQGHCEYFATATALLLRAAGIPARYAVGYSIDEYSPLERQYLGRGHHAHSWALAWINGSWRVVDTTPPVWTVADSAEKSALTPLVDLWSWLTYRIATWDTRDTDDGVSLLAWLAAPLLLYLLWRMFLKKRMSRSGSPWRRRRANRKKERFTGFQELVSRLEQKYFLRDRSEPLGVWMAKIEEQGGPQNLLPLLALHYRRRFDPRGLEQEEESSLGEMIKLKLRELSD
jgi:hypothetical protein